MLDLICPPHLAMGSTHNWSRQSACTKVQGLCGQVRGFVSIMFLVTCGHLIKWGVCVIFPTLMTWWILHSYILQHTHYQTPKKVGQCVSAKAPCIAY
jgi:hypothetical protein